MRIPIVLACVILFTSAWAQEASVPAREAAGYKTISEAELKADVGFLASDSLQGRLSLQPGDDAAAQWVASEFQKAGLEPAVNGGYLQPVPLIEFRPDRAQSYVEMLRAGQTLRWKSPEAYGSFMHDVTLTAPVVFAGFGITAPELKYDDYQGIDVKGKIVLIFDHEPQEDDPHSVFNGTGNTRYATSRVKVRNAQEHGAAAVLLVAEPNRKHLSNQERVARIGGITTRAIPLPMQALADNSLHTPAVTISDAAAKELLAKAGATPADLQSGIDRDLRPQSRALADTQVTLHLQNLATRSGTAYNAVGLLKGSDPKLSEETILISGHHDHDGMSLDQIWHGADDNGSGTVGVVELAHALAANSIRPKRSILFVVFAAEERGLLGSFYLAEHPLRPLEATRAMINFDMIGRDETPSDQTNGLIEIPKDTTNRLNLIGATYSPDYNHVIQQENKLIGLQLDYRFDHDSALNVFFRSDQFPFVLHNVPALWWFTGFHPDYHHVTDTADKIDYPKMAKILRLAYLCAWRFGDDASTPKFVETPNGNPE